MILNFDEFQKTHQSGSELNNIRIKNFNIFKEKGFPSKKEENWKYTDLKTILSNNLNKLELPNHENTSQYNSEWLLKNFKHNQIILVNGDFVSSTFSFEAKEKIKIKPFKTVLKDKKDFKKIRDYFIDQQNSLASLNHALVHDGIYLEIEDNSSFKIPLIIYNFFNKYFALFTRLIILFLFGGLSNPPNSTVPTTLKPCSIGVIPKPLFKKITGLESKWSCPLK